MIKAVFLDIDNTLLDFHACAYEGMRQALAEHGQPCPEGIIPVFHRINDSLWQAIERGEITKAQLYQRRWPSIFAEMNIPLDGEEFEKRFVELLKIVAVRMPHAIDLLEYLKPRYPLYAATNAPRPQQMSRLEKSGILPYLTDVFISEEIGYPKPSREFFDACFAKLPGLKPEDVIIIGDSLTADISGGESYGLRTCWFNREGIPCPADVHPDHTVSDLREIMSIL